jgi:MoxR-like ATPase
MKIYGNNEVLATLEIAFAENLPTLLVGQTGTGKNTILRYIAEKMGRTDVVRINLTGETTVEDLLGRVQLKDGNTQDQDGNVTLGVRNGKVVILDEINACQPEVLFALQSLLDDDHSLTLPNGEVVKAHKDFRVFATMNPNSGYVGTKSLNKAFMSRFGVVLEVDYVDPQTEVELLSAVVPKADKKDLLIMVETARIARHRLANDQLSFPISTRDLIYWATMTVKLNDITKAFQHTILNKADSDKRDLLSILNEAIRESASTSDYRDELEKKIRTILDRINCSEQTRSILRADADKLLNALEKVEAIAYKRDRMVEEVTQEVNSNLAKARKDVKDIATTLQAEALKLATSEKETYERGKADATAEIYKKLGLTPKED